MNTIDLVIKVGSMSLINAAYGDMNYNTISRLSRELRPGMVLVTSGATEIGRLDYVHRNGCELEGDIEAAKTDYSAQGQSILMANYRQYVDSKYSIRQILVEHQHFNDTQKREHLRQMLLRCPSQNAIPIINYNDAVNDEENRKLEISNLKRKFSEVAQCVDNDETASRISVLVQPTTLLILSVIDGIYDNPSDTSTLIPQINAPTINELYAKLDELKEHCNGSSRKGANGAVSKLEYIKKPLAEDTKVIIANAKYPIADILNGAAPRTLIFVG